MKEAIERTFEPPEVHHERLFVISVLGFFVNLVGIFVFQHGGQCSHNHGSSHSCSQSHKHDHHHDHSHHYEHTHISSQHDHLHTGVVALDMNGYVKQPADIHRSHSHAHEDGDEYPSDDVHLLDHSHGRREKPSKSGRGQIMQSVLLHIIADTLGSVGVMISAVLMNQFGWLIADPICSLFIAILISISVYPLLRDSIYVLMQRVPKELEDKLPDCLEKIGNLPGVLSLHEAHFWTLNSDIYVGCLKLEVAHAASQRNILENTKSYLNQIGVERHHIQIDQA